ncbi:MAG: DEAD/DEAH box helicase [Chitinophagales bacterium]|nr:DEAD/DEAH box helicase [Chitinophagales bacterium]
MRKYTANYTYTNPNFVIQNLITNQTNADLLPILCVAKNILQRGFPTMLSKYLQSELGEIHKLDNFNERFLFATNHTPVWNDTIKGDKEQNYYPAKDFFQKIIPTAFGKYSFIQSILIPEIEINEIVGEDDRNFINQQVDFYLPQAKLVIEIDGQQHKLDEVTRISDATRDNYLLNKGITTIRISTKELKSGSYVAKIEAIQNHLERYEKLLNFYKEACQKIEENKISEEEINTKLLPTAVIRFQILIIELLTYNYLTFGEDWNFNILCVEDLPGFAELAISDVLIWVDKLWQLKYKQALNKPNFNIKITKDPSQFQPTTKAVNIDFSLFKRYTDENRKSEDIIFVRTDYFDKIKDKNYFKVSTSEPIDYNITDEDRPTLEFFLNNIFSKPAFRDGQFPIISNALNRKDTIGLLPTGGGKSLCYQLPCLLQPSINFVVCPIKSLMYDQNDNLVKALITNVNFITSDIAAEERREIEMNFERGQYLFVWISPEKFQIPSFREKISSIVANFSIAYAVVDEVHCLSEWGHDFRTSYLNLAKTIDKLSPRDAKGEGKIKFIGLTATASVNVLKDIKIEFSRRKQRLEDENIKSLLDYSRKELQFEVINDNGNKSDKLKELLTQLKDTEGFTETTEKAGLVFTPNVNGTYGCYTVANTLSSLFQNKVGWFSGDIPKVDELDQNGNRTGRKLDLMPRDEFNKHKQQVQKDFKNDKFQLLAATKAFGMGIDKQNVFYTFHYGLPSSVEALYQEAGRAGRWDKRDDENKTKVGKCYVLLSPETHEQEKVERLFHKDTTFAEIKAISDEVGFAGKDIFKQIFLFVQGQNDIEKDFEIILAIVSNYFEPSSKIRIFWNEAYLRLKISAATLQKAIYRLSLLGIVYDWTTNFIDHYEVHFKSLDANLITQSVSDYISKYEPNTDVKSDLEKIDKISTLEKATWYLLNWTFENIAYSRKQSLKTLSDWCREFENSESFKKRLDSYFVFSETTFVLQHIAENPTEYAKWFEVLTTNNQFLNETEFQKLKDSISRFLESYRNNMGLNFLSGFVRLALNEYNDSDGKMRLESALSEVRRALTTEQQSDFLSRLKVLGKHLSEDQKVELSRSIALYNPEMLIELAEYYDLAYLLNDIYSEKLKNLRQLNKKLYEQLAKI